MHKHNHTPTRLSAIGHSETTARPTAKRFLAKPLPTLVASLLTLTALATTAPQANAAEPPVIAIQPVGASANSGASQNTSPNALRNAQAVASTLADGYMRQFAGEVVVCNNLVEKLENTREFDTGIINAIAEDFQGTNIMAVADKLKNTTFFRQTTSSLQRKIFFG